MPNYYDSVYKKNNNFCGQKPNKLFVKIFKNSPKGKEALDLGCGQGCDSFYLARKKFNVIAVDNYRVAITQIKKALQQKNIKNIRPIYGDIAKFKIKNNAFGIINCHNALQFLLKKDALRVIKNIKKNILPGGFVSIASFTQNNPPSKRRRCHFKIGEMKKLFSNPDFKIIHYFEGDFFDKGHAGQPEPHKHKIVEIVAKKAIKK